VDLREDDLLPNAHGEVALAVEPLGADSLEVADARQGDVEETVAELPHAVAPQGDLDADGEALAQLEARDRLPRPAHDRLLTGDEPHVGDRRVDDLRVLHRLTEAH